MKKIITLLLVCCSSLYAQDTYIYAGKIFDSKSGKTKKEKTIIIEDNIITYIKNGFVSPETEGVNVIDLKSKTLIPGLIDFHVHMESESGGKKDILIDFKIMKLMLHLDQQ